MSTILLRGARQIVTLRGSGEPRRGPALKEIHPIADGAVLISGGSIVQVGPTRRLENLAGVRQAIEIDATGRVVMPGFVDSHTHLAFPAGADDEHTAQRIRSSTGQFMEARARKHLLAMARHGTTTVEAKTGCGADESAESKMLRVLSALRGDPLDLVPSFLCRLPPEDPEAAAQRITGELLPKIRRRRIAHFADVAFPADPQLLPLCDAYMKAARALGFRRKVHADTPATECAVELAVRNGASGIDHLEYASAEDARRIGEAGLITTLMPAASLRDDRVPPARCLIENGAAIALATNFHPSYCPALNMQTAIALATLRMGLSVEEAITAATVNAAYAIGEGARTGSLEPGKAADLVILNISDLRDLPECIGTNMVHKTIKGGVVIYEEGDVELPAGRDRLLSA